MKNFDGRLRALEARVGSRSDLRLLSDTELDRRIAEIDKIISELPDEYMSPGQILESQALDAEISRLDMIVKINTGQP